MYLVDVHALQSEYHEGLCPDGLLSLSEFTPFIIRLAVTAFADGTDEEKVEQFLKALHDGAHRDKSLAKLDA
jgi:hypothetical protein